MASVVTTGRDVLHTYCKCNNVPLWCSGLWFRSCFNNTVTSSMWFIFLGLQLWSVDSLHFALQCCTWCRRGMFLESYHHTSNNFTSYILSFFSTTHFNSALCVYLFCFFHISTVAACWLCFLMFEQTDLHFRFSLSFYSSFDPVISVYLVRKQCNLLKKKKHRFFSFWLMLWWDLLGFLYGQTLQSQQSLPLCLLHVCLLMALCDCVR